MTLDLAAIEARAAAATAGPWDRLHVYVWSPMAKANVAAASALREGTEVGYSPPTLLALDEPVANAEFIAHAREDIPALLAAVRTLEAANRDALNWQHAAESRAEAAERRVVELEAQAKDLVAVVDLWQAKGVEYEARVTALEEALREFVTSPDIAYYDSSCCWGCGENRHITDSCLPDCLIRRAAALLSKGGGK